LVFRIKPAVMVGLLQMERLQLSKGRQPSETEKNIATAFNQLENTEAFKALKDIKVCGVKEIKIGGETNLIITVPYKQIEAVKKMSAALVPELEKKVNKKLAIVGAHRAFPKSPEKGRRYKAIRPYGRTLRSVNDALLEDLVFPTTIVGKRIHYDLKGKQATKVILDENDKTRCEDRLQLFSAAYDRLTGIKAVFEVAQH